MDVCECASPEISWCFSLPSMVAQKCMHNVATYLENMFGYRLLTIQYVYDYAEVLEITNCARIVAGVGLVDFRYGQCGIGAVVHQLRLDAENWRQERGKKENKNTLVNSCM